MEIGHRLPLDAHTIPDDVVAHLQDGCLDARTLASEGLDQRACTLSVVNEYRQSAMLHPAMVAAQLSPIRHAIARTSRRAGLPRWLSRERKTPHPTDSK